MLRNRKGGSADCSWDENGMRCPTGIVPDSSARMLAAEPSSGNMWCPFHAPHRETTHNDVDDETIRQLFREIVLRQVTMYNHIVFPGCRLPLSLALSADSLLNEEIEEGWASKLSKINLCDAVIDGNVRIDVPSTRPLSIELQGAKISEDVQLTADNLGCFGDIDLDSIEVARVLIKGSATELTEARRISLRNLNCSGTVEVARLRVGSGVDLDGATVGLTFCVRDCVVGTPFRTGNDALSPGDPLDRLLQPVLRMSETFSNHPSSFGQIVIDSCRLHGSVAFGQCSLSHLVQISCSKIDGIIERSAATLPEGSLVFDLEQAAGFVSLPPVAGNDNSEKPYERARLRRSFSLLRSAAVDSDQRSSLLRQERRALPAVRNVATTKSTVWRLHEYLNDAGANWRHPLILLLLQAILFTMLLAWLLPGSQFPHAVSVSVANTFAPFLSLQSMVEVNNLTEVLISIAQSGISAGLISAIYLAIRAEFVH